MDKSMRVPLNQREYAWETRHVEDLLRDLDDAQGSDESDYFLGMIVLTLGDDGTSLIADGQQRLATTSILLAAIRDLLIQRGEQKKAAKIDDRFLQTSGYRDDDAEPKLRLNVIDDEFFRKRILSLPGSPDRSFPATSPSHRLIEGASAFAARYVERIGATGSREKQNEALINWVEFIQDRARVVLVTASDEYGAYRMFETLNDRGVEAAQSDLVKNFLFGKSANRMAEVQQRWAAMVGTLDLVPDDEIVVTYLHHYYIVNYGFIRRNLLFQKIKDRVHGKSAAIEFADGLAAFASDYIALLLPQHEKWNAYGTDTSKHIEALLLLRAEQIRPLLFAVARHFTIPEAQKAFRLFVSWSVRILVGGGSRAGRIDREYGERAAKIGAGSITTADDLAKDMGQIIPSDAEFKANFAVATIGRADLARYVLRSLELQNLGTPGPEKIPNEDAGVVNLEHILPANPGKDWPVDLDAAPTLYRRIGNMALLPLSENRAIGNGSYSEKAAKLRNSTFTLTAKAGTAARWDASAIAERQQELAEIAVKTWPISVSSPKPSSSRRKKKAS